jgi:hypothetical protein
MSPTRGIALTLLRLGIMYWWLFEFVGGMYIRYGAIMSANDVMRKWSLLSLVNKHLYFLSVLGACEPKVRSGIPPVGS